MSYQIGMDVLRLRGAQRVGHTEYCSNEALMRAVKAQAEADGGRAMRFADAWELDFLWVTNDGPVGFSKGRSTDMGHADFLEGGVDRREAKPSPFKSVEEVWAFDAVAEYQPLGQGELVKYYQDWYRQGQQDNPNQVFTGGYYHTMVSGAIGAFGWENLLEAAAEQGKFEKVLDSFFRLTLLHVRAQAKTDIEVFITHDDMVWSEGPFMDPAFYRRVIFPRYAALWRVLHEAGKIVLFCSDAKFSMFVDDIFAAGADGLIFEPMTLLEPIVERYGKSKVIVGSKVDCRTMTFGTKDAIQREIDATLKIAKGCPGFMFAVGNHIPSNVPVENALFYFEYLRKHWGR